ncbi:hypothetical protein VZT92_001050 [Zoarces viviparus]|uniref:HTH psq-type domain-containing protein n=1 Tax=Zoarces viviparus TaxID=48416 RepID=A0AAW1GBV8_ZOAVI
MDIEIVNLQRFKIPNMRQVRKRERKTRKWTQEAMAQALLEVKAGRLSLWQAAQQFGVTKSSLSDRVSGRVSYDCVYGQRTLLTPEDEDSLVEYCLYSASHGFPLTKPQVLGHALAIYNLRHREAQRTVLGQTWWINFWEQQHHRLTARTPDIIDRGRASCAKRGSDMLGGDNPNICCLCGEDIFSLKRIKTYSRSPPV